MRLSRRKAMALKDKPELTEKEKWECIVRWVNQAYRYSCFPEDYPEIEPCSKCPLMWKKCPQDLPQRFFKVLEKYTGEGTVVGETISTGL